MIDVVSREFREAHPLCEVSPYMGFGRRVVEDIHHVIGKNPKGRTSDVRNMVAVSRFAHDWLHRHANVGRVLCCRILEDAGRLDWEFLSELDGRCWPGLFHQDAYRVKCQKWPFIEEMRRRFVS